MGLRCLLGHNFGEPELRREREEDGSEVVTTVTEVKTCARCGETQVVSENTEVTTMEQLTDEATAAGRDTTADPAPASDGPAGPDGVETGVDSGTAGTGTAGLGGDTDTDDAVIIDDDATGGSVEPNTADAATAGAERSDPSDPAASTAGAEADVEADAAAEGGGAELIDDGQSGAGEGPESGDEGAESGLERDEGEYAAYPEAETTETEAETLPDEERAETDDGVILDEEGESADDRERGAWPDVDESEEGAGATTPWPEHGGEDEGFSAEIGEGDAGDVEFGGGLTPETADSSADDEDAEYVEAPAQSAGEASGAAGAGGTADEGVGITRGESPDLETSSSEVTTEYYCPECEMTRSADGNSMRAGDICPECKRGYVDERAI
ncbi:hypothetical protein C471_08300 [Halorubrum saccharovorum DSM 1137]|uniref:Uncharacterized protein n=1 Tax=Halorubrum saccharovorum DSM 1137 TaxID=1227484 RepID=M0DXD2_9EURY|nr:hypothetical protein [Halorubrum saccharovorum]ELZ40156.1 hypothetical protein C471_08300 [Halorubrum saccharovorum DSM 1137]